MKNKYDKTKYAIPYMGSKRKHAKEIVEHIIKHNSKMKYFYDLFGGGGAISFEMLKYKNIKVIYNEYDPAIVNLIKKIRDDGITPEFYRWIDRDEFFKYKDGTDWFSGMIKTCWSFGNKGDGYIFGKKIEPLKKLLHHVVVDRCQKSAVEFNKHFGTDIQVKDIKDETINERRLNLMRYIKSLDKRFDLEQLEQLKRLELQNLSYEQVPIETTIEETVIYCDPPYKNTGKYQNNIDHDKFNEWVKNNPYKIYISEYNSCFNEVWSKGTRSTLSATSNNTKRTERLYCNKKEIKLELF